MPEWLERKIRIDAMKAGLKPGTSAFNRYVYKILNKIKQERVKKRHKK